MGYFVLGLAASSTEEIWISLHSLTSLLSQASLFTIVISLGLAAPEWFFPLMCSLGVPLRQQLSVLCACGVFSRALEVSRN
jgi:hypothetical protein|uniref:Uncharacterized protein n=1 Tax=Picea glauca TaxID=3330 RepID=A0A101LV09_PICGL|nr:hypothetical protein ABT39_MTgene2218 [Picea glauca]QHR86647.1 hypothetical protein Q903MT_gene650 [Picea sitchensis]